ncbi:hypothetical protein B0H17DRAFT_1177722 [Mycena rosella]|uniref:Uncharacterized protein n=1 Tax=Mycena rosella TaxID=1033263 RepID=A0AAD7DST8_MYCRO|nr:hypothetical protein B0H17DRAFT_1177722 [Mycena rosella]
MADPSDALPGGGHFNGLSLAQTMLFTYLLSILKQDILLVQPVSIPTDTALSILLPTRGPTVLDCASRGPSRGWLGAVNLVRGWWDTSGDTARPTTGDSSAVEKWGDAERGGSVAVLARGAGEGLLRELDSERNSPSAGGVDSRTGLEEFSLGGQHNNDKDCTYSCCEAGDQGVVGHRAFVAEAIGREEGCRHEEERWGGGGGERGGASSLFGTDSWLDAELKLRGMPANTLQPHRNVEEVAVKWHMTRNDGPGLGVRTTFPIWKDPGGGGSCRGLKKTF